jgi:intracellular septation protein A
MTGYYTYLNLYERSENDRKKIYMSLQATQNELKYTQEAWKKQNTLHGLFFVLTGVMSMVMIYILKN